MPFIPHRSSQYSLISQSQEEESLEPGSSRQTKAWHRTVSIYTYCVGFALMAIVCFVLGYVLGKGLSSHISPAVSTCTNPITRHEWRTLSVTEKDDYIAAVQCLRDRPSRLGLNQTLYDDFPWLHAHIGLPSHFSAGFLSWHRYFIHIYESTLQRQCDFQGHLAYWDWSLDWEDISKSPVFDPSHGFGGDGNATGETTVGHGRCVIDGPFNGLVVPVFGSKDDPHCLSRGFLQGEAYNTEVGSKVKPSAIDSILDAHNYQDFNLGLEDGPHLGIPFGVRGDFLQFTAPYGKHILSMVFSNVKVYRSVVLPPSYPSGSSLVDLAE